MIAPKQEKVFGILDLIAQQQKDVFQALLASVHVVSEEQVVCLWRPPAHVEQPEQVLVLSVCVTDNLDGRTELDKRRLGQEDFPSGLAYCNNLMILERRLRQLAHAVVS